MPGPRQRDLFRMDAARWVRPQEVAELAEVTWRRVVVSLYRHVPLRAMAWYRIASWAKHSPVPAVSGILQRRLIRLYGIEMVPGAAVGGGLYIAHPVGCTLVAAHIGTNVTVVAGVVLGARHDAVWPWVGDRVLLGAGARVLGGVEVGAGASVGANAVVVHDVPPGATVVGVPARPVRRAAAQGGESA